MLILKYYFQNPQKGYDPVLKEYVRKYSEAEYGKDLKEVINDIQIYIDDFNGKKILDLGAGPGQFTLEFARKGGIVTWHDISRNYLEFAKMKSKESGVNIDFNLAYLEEIQGYYDFVFNRICWYYCIDDYSFAKKIYNSLNENGIAYIIANNESFLFKRLKSASFLNALIIKTCYYINEITNVKLMHVHPSHKKLTKVFSRFNFKSFECKRNGDNTIITFRK